MKKQSLYMSFANALRGIKHALRERNFLIQFTVGGLAIIFAFALNLSWLEKILVIMLTGIVLGSELINSSIERLLNIVISKQDPKASRIKDLSAGAVLILSLTALIVGLMIFIRAIFYN